MYKLLKFKPGKVYKTRSACDSRCIFEFKVIKRTNKNIWITGVNGLMEKGQEVKRKIHIIPPINSQEREAFYPFGRYALAPIVLATGE